MDKGTSGQGNKWTREQVDKGTSGQENKRSREQDNNNNNILVTNSEDQDVLDSTRDLKGNSAVVTAFEKLRDTAIGNYTISL